MIKFKRPELPGQFTGNYTSTNVVTIPDVGGPVQDIINISDIGILKTITVSVDITHTFIGDLQITLISPNETEAILHYNTGGGADNLVTTFTIATNSSTLNSIFKNQAINGNWVLVIQDTAAGDAGTLNSWTINLTYN